MRCDILPSQPNSLIILRTLAAKKDKSICILVKDSFEITLGHILNPCISLKDGNLSLTYRSDNKYQTFFILAL
jgi:hypothetical protein